MSDTKIKRLSIRSPRALTASSYTAMFFLGVSGALIRFRSGFAAAAALCVAGAAGVATGLAGGWAWTGCACTGGGGGAAGVATFAAGPTVGLVCGESGCGGLGFGVAGACGAGFEALGTTALLLAGSCGADSPCFIRLKFSQVFPLAMAVGAAETQMQSSATAQERIEQTDECFIEFLPALLPHRSPNACSMFRLSV